VGRRTAVGVLACALLLAGCAEKHEASQSLPAAPSTPEGITAQVLPAVGPADFPVPAEARQRTPAGVQAFTRYYIALINHELASLDSAPLRALSRHCGTCDNLADGYEANRNAGYHYRGGEVTITSTGAPSLKGDEAEIAFNLHQAAVDVLDDSGTPVPGRAHGSYPLTGGISLRWDASLSTWLVTRLTAEAP
jgi:hypothetical protein